MTCQIDLYMVYLIKFSPSLAKAIDDDYSLFV